MLVRATDEFMKKGVKPEELKRIPKAGVEFEIKDSRFELLSGKNKYKVKFVEKVETENEETKEEEDAVLEEDKEEGKTTTKGSKNRKNKSEEDK